MKKSSSRARRTLQRPSFRARRHLALTGSIVSLLGLTLVSARAVQPQFFFDPSGTGGTAIGGSGTWDLTNTYWFDGTNDVLYPNLTGASAAVAVFGGATGGAVEINGGGGSIIANGIVFNTTGYSLTNTDAVATDTITLDGVAGIPTLTVTNATDTATISAVLAGTAGANVNGLGTLVLSGANTLTGALTLSSGTLRAQGNTAALGAGTLTLAGGTLQLANDTGLSFGRNTTVSANATIVSDTLTSVAGVNHTLGTLTVQGASTLTVNAGSNATGNTAAVTFGATTLSANGEAFNVGANANLNLGALTGAFSFAKQGLGTLNLTGASARTAGTVTVSAGTLKVSNATALGTSAVPLALTGGTVDLDVDSGLTAYNTTVTANSTVLSGRATTGAGVTQTLGTLSNGAVLTIGPGANVNANSAYGVTFGATTLTANAGFNVANNGTAAGTLTLGLIGDSGSNFALAKTGAGTLVANSANTYGGVTTLTGGIFSTSSLANGGANSGLGKSSSAAGNLVLDGGALVYTGAAVSSDRLFTVTANGGSILNNAAVAVTLGNTGAEAITGTGSRVLTLGGTGTSLTLAGVLTDPASGTLGITKTGTSAVILTGNNTFTGPISVQAGSLQRRVFGGTPSANAVALSGGSYDLRFDGDGTSTPQSVNVGDSVTVSAATTITVDRIGLGVAGNTGFANYYTTPLNKTVQEGALSINASTLTVTPASGYGLEFTGGTTFAGAPTFNVGVATGSNVVQGLTLSGAVTGGFGLVKTGLGTLVLNNNTTANNFGTGGTLIDIQGGIISVSSDQALGDAANGVKLNINAATGAGLRATGTFATSRTISLAQASNAIEVTQGNTLTLNTALSAAAATNALFKNDNGILVLNADPGSTTYNGVVTVNAGALQLGAAGGLGTATGNTVVANAVGAALQLAGASTAEPLSLSNTGINTLGALQGVAGTASTASGAITLANAATIGADTGATLNLTGSFGGTTAAAATFAGAGAINITFPLLTGTSLGAITKINSGVTTLSGGAGTYTGTINVNQGVFQLKGNGTTLGATGALTVLDTGALVIDDTLSTTANRGGGRPVTLNGGVLEYVGGTGTSTETLGALTVNRPGSIVAASPTGAGTSTLTFASLASGTESNNLFLLPTAANLATYAAGVLNLPSVTVPTGTTIGGATNKIVFTTAPTLTNNILPRAVVVNSGTFDFATYASGTVSAYSGYNLTQNVTQAVAADNLKISTATSVNTLFATQTLNSVSFAGGGSTLGAVTLPFGAAITTLTNGSGGFLATGGASTLSVPVVNVAAVQGVFHVDAGSTLTLNGSLLGSAGWVKAEPGTLVLNSPASPIPGLGSNQMIGNFAINGGTVKLAGGNNTLFPNQFLLLNQGGTLDLNGTAEFVQGLFSDNGVTGGGGLIVNTAATAASLLIGVDNAARSFGGSIQGNTNVTRASSNTITFSDNNTFTGTFTTVGGTVALADGGRFSGVSGVTIGGATLQLSNTGTINLTDRLNDAAPITLNGGTLQLLGRAQLASTETVGAINSNLGANTLTATAGGTGINSADLTVGAITRGFGSTLNISTGATVGSAGRVLSSVLTAPVGMLNPGIITNAGDFTGYNPVTGFGGLSQAGYRGYDGTTLASMVSGNVVNLGATTALTATTTTVKDLRIGGAFNITFPATGGVLQIEEGGLLGTNTTVLGATTSTLTRGVLTAGTAASTGVTELLNYSAGALTINSVITDVKTALGTGTGTTAYVKSGAGTVTLTAANTYTGGTYVDQGTLNLSTTAALAAGTYVIPAAGGLTISNATVTENGFANQFDPATVVTLNGGAVLNMYALTGGTTTNQIGGLIINNNGGGSTTPAINSTTGGSVVNLFGNITATPTNTQTIGTVNGRIDFGTVQRTITVNANPAGGGELQGGFNLQGIVGTTGGLIKQGAGVLQTIGQQLYTGTTEIAQGTYQLSTATNVGSRFSDYLIDTGALFNLNNITTNIGSLGGGGTVFSSTGTPTLYAGFSNADSTFSGKFLRFSDATTNDVNLVKIGTGTLSLTGAGVATQASTGNLTVNQGTVTYSDVGQGFFGTNIVNNGGKLILDNTATNLVNRLGGNTRNLTVAGGEFILKGAGASAAPATGDARATLGTQYSNNLFSPYQPALPAGATSETLNQLNNGSGAGFITLQPTTAGPTFLNFNTVQAANVGSGLQLVLRGNGLGQTQGTAGNANVFAVQPIPAGGGGGGAGSAFAAIRPDILVDSSATGTGTGFAYYVPGYGFRALAGADLQTNYGTSLNIANFGVSGNASIPFSIGTLSSITSSGGTFTAAGEGSVLTLTTGGLLATGGTTTFTGGQLSLGNQFEVWANGGDVVVNSLLIGSSSQGLVKGGSGTLTLNSQGFLTGNHTVNAGTLIIGSSAPDNAILVYPTNATPQTEALVANGGTFDLNGHNLIVGDIRDNNPLPGTGGTVTNTGATAVTLTSSAGNATFGGVLAGNLNYVRNGNVTTILTSQTPTRARPLSGAAR